MEKLQVIIEAQTKAYYDELKKVQQQTKSATSAVVSQTKKIKNALSGIGKTLGIALSVTALVKFGSSCIELGSDLAEVQNVVDVTFGAMKGTINEFARNATVQFGLSETSAKQFTSTMGAMLKSMGFTTSAAAGMSMEITGLAADMASFYNLDSKEAFNKIRSGISGETEPLKQLGINMSVANLEAYALSQGITKAYNSMSQQEQALLRYNYLMSVTADAQGDFERTSDGWANQVRVLTERFNSLKAVIGQGLIAVLTPVIRVLNELLAKILTVTDAFSNFISKITGKKTQTETAVAGVANATDTATEAAQEAKKAMGGLLSMDEVHSLSKDRKEDSGSGAGGDLSETVVDAATETDSTLNPVLDKLIEKLKELKDFFKTGFKEGLGDVDFSGITKAVDGIKTSLKDIFTNVEVGDAANGFMNTLAHTLGQEVGAITSIGTTIATNLLGGFDKYLEENKDRISGFIVNMFDIESEVETIRGNFSEAAANIFSVFGGENGQQLTSNILGIFSEVWMSVSEIAGKIGTDVYDLITRPFIDNQEGFKTTIDNLLGVASESLGTLKQTLEDTFTKAKEVYDEHMAPMMESLTSGLSDLVGKVVDGYNTHIAPVLSDLQEKFQVLMSEHIQPAIDKGLELIGKVIDALKELWENVLAPLIGWFIENIYPVIAEELRKAGDTIMAVWALISDTLGYIFEALGGLIDFVVGIFTGDWNKAWEGIKTFFSSIWEGIKNIVSTIFESIKEKISNILGKIKATWSKLWNGMKTTVLSIFRGIWNGIKGIINSILGGIEKMANGVIGGINSMINALNKLKFDIPDWVPGLGGKTFGLNIPTISEVSIPRLAEGGIVDRATVAMIGEAGREAVVPLENNTGWMDKIAARLGEIVAMNISTIVDEMYGGEELQPIRTIVQLDGKTLLEQLDKVKRRRGYQMANA